MSVSKIFFLQVPIHPLPGCHNFAYFNNVIAYASNFFPYLSYQQKKKQVARKKYMSVSLSLFFSSSSSHAPATTFCHNFADFNNIIACATNYFPNLSGNIYKVFITFPVSKCFTIVTIKGILPVSWIYISSHSPTTKL